MIGNDVIDLALAQKDSNWQRPGFLHKIFSVSEQELIYSVANPEQAVWNLWSRKEAAYKILARQNQIRRFMPLQLSCLSLDALSTVQHKEMTFHTQTAIEEDCIHTIATTIAADLLRAYEIPPQSKITKVGVLPFLENENGALQPISVSHHGRFHFVVGLK